MLKVTLKNLGKGITWPFKLIYFIIERLAERPIIIGILMLILISYFVINTTLKRGESYEGEFLKNILMRLRLIWSRSEKKRAPWRRCCWN